MMNSFNVNNFVIWINNDLQKNATFLSNKQSNLNNKYSLFISLGDSLSEDSNQNS